MTDDKQYLQAVFIYSSIWLEMDRQFRLDPAQARES